MKSKDFHAVITDGYMGDLAKMLFEQLTTPVSMRALQKEDCDKGLQSITDLKSYIGYDGFKGDISRDAQRAKETIEDLQSQLKQIG